MSWVVLALVQSRPEDLGGSATTINVVGASLRPLVRMAYDAFGSYAGALLVLAVLPLICAVAVLFIRAPDLGTRNQAAG